MNARLHDSVGRTDDARSDFEERLRADGLLLRKMFVLDKRGDWTVCPNVEATAAGGLTGPRFETIEEFRAAITSAVPSPVGRFACV